MTQNIDQTIFTQLQQAGISLRKIASPAFVVGETMHQVSNIGFRSLQDAQEKTDGKVLVVYELTQLPIEGQAELATLVRGALVESDQAGQIKDWNTYQEEQGFAQGINTTQGIPKQ